MDITNKMLSDLAGQLGIDAGSGTIAGNKGGAAYRSGGNAGASGQVNMNDVKKIADSYKGKSDSELLSEIARVKETIKKDRSLYEQQLKAVQALRPMMNVEQRARLDKIIELLGD